MRVSDFCIEDLGQPKVEASAVSAVIKDALGQPYTKAKVSAVLAQTGGEIASGAADDQGRVLINVPSSGLIIKLVPQPGFLNKAVPEDATVVSKPTSGLFGKWGWGDSANFVIYPKKAEDFVTLNTLIAVGVAGFIVWYFFKAK
jgi:hypothetical protein